MLQHLQITTFNAVMVVQVETNNFFPKNNFIIQVQQLNLLTRKLLETFHIYITITC